MLAIADKRVAELNEEIRMLEKQVTSTFLGDSFNTAVLGTAVGTIYGYIHDGRTCPFNSVLFE